MMKRITIISGHYGSGKSEISVNLAIQKKIDYLIDLDIINPYFRSRSLDKLLEKNNIHLVESTIKGMLGSDLPYVSGEGVIPFIKPDITAIYDLGGTENGVKVLIQFLDRIKTFNEIDFLCTVNIFRPETSDVKSILNTISMYESITRLKITGLINNTNLIKETTEEDIIKGERILQEVSKKLNVPILYTVIEESHNQEYKYKFLGERLVLTRYVAQRWL
ncbi:MAG: ATP-binding protein [Candidatus Izimaplasma sp.]|nr:ATP-binding protein [Candidatus Izimaplasma bacterium]